MKYVYHFVVSLSLFLLCSCAIFGAREPDPAPAAHVPKPLVLPVGKNWQVIEEAPKLSDGSRLPFQTEQSLQPGGTPAVSPEDNRRIETSR